ERTRTARRTARSNPSDVSWRLIRGGARCLLIRRSLRDETAVEKARLRRLGRGRSEGRPAIHEPAPVNAVEQRQEDLRLRHAGALDGPEKELELDLVLPGVVDAQRRLLGGGIGPDRNPDGLPVLHPLLERVVAVPNLGAAQPVGELRVTATD